VTGILASSVGETWAIFVLGSLVVWIGLSFVAQVGWKIQFPASGGRTKFVIPFWLVTLLVGTFVLKT
jgi:hypothetical protein